MSAFCNKQTNAPTPGAYLHPWPSVFDRFQNFLVLTLSQNIMPKDQLCRKEIERGFDRGIWKTAILWSWQKPFKQSTYHKLKTNILLKLQKKRAFSLHCCSATNAKKCAKVLKFVLFQIGGGKITSLFESRILQFYKSIWICRDKVQPTLNSSDWQFSITVQQ